MTKWAQGGFQSHYFWGEQMTCCSHERSANRKNWPQHHHSGTLLTNTYFIKTQFFFSYKQLTHHFHGLLIPVWSLSCDALSKSPHSKSIYSQESLLTRVMFILMSKVKAKKWFGSWGQYLTNMPTSWRMCVSSTTKNMCKLNLVTKNAKARIYKNNCNTCLVFIN